MDALLKRHFWLVIVALGTVSTFFLSAGATQLVAGKYLPLEASAVTRAAPKGPAGSASAPPTRNVAAKSILESNPFDSVTGPIRSPLENVFATPPISVDANIDAKEQLFTQCPGPTKLEITIVDPQEPKRSFAVFSTGEGIANKPMVREGGSVGGRSVAVIVREKVYFREGSSYCFIGMFMPPPPPAPPPSAGPVPGGPEAPLPPGAPPRIPPEIEKGIQRVDETNFNIDRIVVDKIIENQAELMKSARIVPEQENGKVVGIRLLNIRPDTLLGKLGMQAGDQLRTINGFEMSSPEKALEAYAKLRTAPSIQIGVVRNGKPVNIDFQIK
jgi:general secretion pathway protein C